MKTSTSPRKTARKLIASLFCGVAAASIIALAPIMSFGQDAPTSPSAPDAPKAPKSRASVTIMKDGEVVFSKSVDKNTVWRSLDEAINNEVADSVKQRLRSALRDAGKRVNISATGNTMTIVVDDENSKDGKNMVMSFSSDGFDQWGREFADGFRRNFDVGRNHFRFDTGALRDMANRFRVMVAPHARRFNFNNFNVDDEDFTSDKAERMAEEANNMSREADALRKEAEAMRLEAEAMKKRAEATRLEAQARKKSSKATSESQSESKSNDAQSSTKKKKQ